MKIGIALLTFCLAATSAAAETVTVPTNVPVAYSKDVFAAVRFATRDRQVMIVRIQSASAEGATSKNFRLCLHVRSDIRRFNAAAIIFRSPSGRFSLTQWNPGGC